MTGCMLSVYVSRQSPQGKLRMLTWYMSRLWRCFAWIAAWQTCKAADD